MPSNLHIGKRGEAYAFDYLVQCNHLVLERNWRFSKSEIDIIYKEDDILVFVEVKTRSYTYFGKPEESVGEKKQKLMIDAAFQYMKTANHDWEVRFDIISIVLKGKDDFKLEHFKDVFF